MKKLLFILFLLIGSLSYGQTIFTQTYVDRCTGDVKVVVANFQNGSATVAFYNKVRTFTYQEFLSGELQQWLTETYLWWQQLSPCSTATAETQQAQQTAQNATQAAQSASTAASSAATSATSSVPPPSTNTTNTNATSTTNTSSSSTSNTSSSSTGGNESTGSGTSSGGTEGGTSSGGNTSEGSSNEGGQTTESKTEDTSTETKSESKSESDGGSSEENKETESKETESSEENKEESKEEVKEEEKKEEEKSEEKEEEKKEEESEEKEEDKEESEEKEEEVEEEEKKEKVKMMPIQLKADAMAMQTPFGDYNAVMNIGASQSSVFGDVSYSLNGMVWDNLKQVSFMGGRTKIVFDDSYQVKLIKATSVGYANNYSISTLSLSQSFMKPFKNGMTVGVGISAGTTFESFPIKENFMVSYNVLATKSFKLNDRITYSPALIFTQTPFMSGRDGVGVDFNNGNPFGVSVRNDMKGSRIHFMGIMANSFTVQLTKRFSFNAGWTIIKGSDPNLPMMHSFMIGSKLPF